MLSSGGDIGAELTVEAFPDRSLPLVSRQLQAVEDRDLMAAEGLLDTSRVTCAKQKVRSNAVPCVSLFLGRKRCLQSR
jgi:hypothetical protein